MACKATPTTTIPTARPPTNGAASPTALRSKCVAGVAAFDTNGAAFDTDVVAVSYDSLESSSNVGDEAARAGPAAATTEPTSCTSFSTRFARAATAWPRVETGKDRIATGILKCTMDARYAVASPLGWHGLSSVGKVWRCQPCAMHCVLLTFPAKRV
jgi:hypothetical protein